MGDFITVIQQVLERLIAENKQLKDENAELRCENAELRCELVATRDSLEEAWSQL